MWTALMFLGALHCTVSVPPPSPTNVVFSSVNLRNVLQWFPGNGTPDDTHFTAQYSIYGDSVEGSKGRRVNWRAVRRCTEIVRNWCDLSNETWDLEQGYYARVRAVSQRASSKWALTRRRFDPKTDTSFGPPLFSVEIEDNNAIVTLKGPMRYQSNNYTPAVSMATLYPQMTYNLSIDNVRRDRMHHFTVVSSPYKYLMMEYDTEYCFTAKTKLLSMPIQCQSSGWQCITSPQDPVIGRLKKVVVGIVVPSLCICMVGVVGYLLYSYLTGKGQKSPYILNPPTFHPPILTFLPENHNLIATSIIKELRPESGVLDPACPKHLRHVAPPPPGYASQRPEALPEPEEPWDDLSIDYGFIGMAPEIGIIGEDGNNLKTDEHQKCVARDSYEKKEWRVEDSRETSTLIQAHAWSRPVFLTQTQAPLLSFQGASMGEVYEEEEDRVFPGLFLNSTPQTGLFRIPLNLQTKTEEGVGDEMDEKVRDGEIDGGVKERSENEEVPLLSAYASQNTTDMPTSHSDQSDLPDDYGVLRLAAAHKIEEDDKDEEGTICIDWDPETRKLVFPEMVEFNKQGGLTQGESRGEEEEDSMKGELRLENVFVRQGSEEIVEAQREKERGGGTGWEADDLLTRWNLVISMDQ